MFNQRGSSKIMRNSLIALFLIAISNISFAYDGWSSGKIEKIRIQDTRILITQTGAANPGDCSNTEYLYLELSDSVLSKSSYSAILSAYATGKEVSLALTDCLPEVGYPVVTEVWLQ